MTQDQAHYPRPLHRQPIALQVNRPGHASDRNGPRGTYLVESILGVPGLADAFTNFNWDEIYESGDSLLKLTEGAAVVTVRTRFASGGELPIDAHANANGNVGRISAQMEATSYDHALKISHDAVSMLLSRWSWEYDIPLAVKATKATDVATGCWRWKFEMIATRRQFVPGRAGQLPSQFLPLISSYRDGLNSSEPLWQALSFYKAMEGADTITRSRAASNKASEKMVRSRDRNRRIPATRADFEEHPDDGTYQGLEPYLGWSFRRYRDMARSTIRNASAHLDLNAEHLISDRWDQQWLVRSFIPGLRWVARQWIETELRALDES